MLDGRRIVLGVCGSIACYKAADLASKLTQAGADVDHGHDPAAQIDRAPHFGRRERNFGDFRRLQDVLDLEDRNPEQLRADDESHEVLLPVGSNDFAAAGGGKGLGHEDSPRLRALPSLARGQAGRQIRLLPHNIRSRPPCAKRG